MFLQKLISSAVERQADDFPYKQIMLDSHIVLLTALSQRVLCLFDGSSAVHWDFL